MSDNCLAEKQKTYKATGFVESLIAIAVVSIAGIALMGVATRTISSVLRNEKVDLLTQESLNTVIKVRIIASRFNEAEEDVEVFFPYDNAQEHCYLLDEDISSSVDFKKNGADYIDLPGGTDFFQTLRNNSLASIDVYGIGEVPISGYTGYCVTRVDGNKVYGSAIVGFHDCNDETGDCRYKQDFVVTLKADKL